MKKIGFADQLTDLDQLEELQQRLRLPECPHGSFMRNGKSHLVFYEK
jgi:hypothetical protein